MAGLALGLGTGNQVRLLVELRWRLFCNSLRTVSGRLDLAALLVLGGLATLGALGFGLVFGLGAYQAVVTGRRNQLGVLFWAVSAFWQFYPVVQGALSSAFDVRHLRRFPLRFSTFVLLTCVYDLLDPVAVVALFWLACIAAGLLWVRPDLLFWTLLLVALLAAVNLLLNRLVLSWLEPLFQRRRSRERFLVFLFLSLIVFTLLFPLVMRWGQEFASVWRRFAPVVQVVPPALASRGLTAGLEARTADTAVAAAGLVVSGMLLGLLLGRRLRFQYRGEEPGESAAGAPTQIVSHMQPGWAVPGLHGPLAGVFEKEARYFYRVPALLIGVLGPPIAAAVLLVLRRVTERDLFAAAPDLLFPVLLGYMALAMTQISNNVFAFDSGGVQQFLVAPVTLGDVLLAKNLALGLATLLEAGALWVLVSTMATPPSATAMAAMLLALTFVLLVHFTAGNLLSLYFPRAVGSELRARKETELTALIGFLLQLCVLGFTGGIYYRLRRSGQLTVAPVVFLLLSAGVFPLYLRVLRRCSVIAAQRRDILLDKLCRA